MKFITEANKEDLIDTHFFVTYELVAKDNSNIDKAAWELAIGQSVGNPNLRNKWESESLFLNHSCKIVKSNASTNIVEIAFPYINLDWDTDGVSQLLCMIQGGQSDIENVYRCRVLKLEAPKLKVLSPKYGLSGLKESRKAQDRPLVGGILKPKTGISKETLLDMVKEMVDGGLDFIKEDEILSNPSFCKIEDRVSLISNYLATKTNPPIYSVCINSDPAYVLDRVKLVHKLGGNSVHINFWSGLGVYKSIRELDLPIFIHFQRSGIENITNPSNRYSISWEVICQLAGMSGVDSIHAGMIGGYSSNNDETLQVISTLQKYNVIPALSCGMHPGLVTSIKNRIGTGWMANSGGAIHAHPSGTKAGAKAMLQATTEQYGQEFGEAVKIWGAVK
jgi:ribulose-bisphosphate carboxylase large chain